MAKVTITIEDTPDGDVRAAFTPSPEDAKLPRTNAEIIARHALDTVRACLDPDKTTETTTGGK